MVRTMFDLTNENGFFCLFFFMMTVYIFCRKRNSTMYLNDNKWKFKYDKGWEDYFILNEKHIHLIRSHNKHCKYIRFGHLNIPKKFKCRLKHYKKYIREVYNIKPGIINITNIPKKYNSIFIRGGDKILKEVKKISSHKYVDYLLNLNIETKSLFVHSDDNLIVLEVKNYINNNNIDLNVFSITDNTSNGGAVVRSNLKYRQCKNILSVDEMSKEQKKKHVNMMINAIEIMKNSDNVVLSYDSNTSRFMKLYFECPVFSVNGKSDIDLHSSKHPAYGF